MNRFNKTESAMFGSCFSLHPVDLYSELILSSLQLLLCRVGTVKRLRVHDHNADYIFWSFGTIGIILSQFENRIPLKPVLGHLGTVAPLHKHENTKKIESAISFL